VSLLLKLLKWPLSLCTAQVNARVAAKLAAQEAEAAAAAAGDDKARAALRKKGLLGADGAPAVQNPLKDDRFKWVLTASDGSDGCCLTMVDSHEVC
jgi:hypothetical protein